MKLRIQTLTGETQEVEGEPQNSVLDLKKIIYKQMKITAAVRLLKGQEVLPDGSTLGKQGIIDGSTVNIVIEPEQELNLRMKLGPKVFTHKVLNSVRVCDLKQQLIDGGNVGFSLEDLTLIVSADDNDGITDDIPLEDDSLPLHLYGLNNDMILKVMGKKITMDLVTHYGLHFQKSFPKHITVDMLKQRIQSVDSFFGAHYPEKREDILVFMQRGDSYKKLPDAAPIGSVLSNNDVVYFIEDRFFNKGQLIPVYYKGEDIGRVGCSLDGDKCDTVLSVKLRLQEQLGFPVASIDVKTWHSLGNDWKITSMGFPVASADVKTWHSLGNDWKITSMGFPVASADVIQDGISFGNDQQIGSIRDMWVNVS